MGLFNYRIYEVLVHLLFWSLFIFVSLFLFSNYYWSENPFLQYFFILFGIVYVNNGLLLPYFIRKRYYFAYALIIGAIAFLGTQLYCNYFAECGCSFMKCLSDYLWQTLVPIIFFSFLWMLYDHHKNQENLKIIQKEHTEMELRYLKSQINPHVLLNNLNTIYSYALEQPREVPEMILMLSDNLKHVLYDSNAHKIALEKELDYIANYIAFQKIRAENLKHIDYKLTVDDTKHTIAPLLLITLIENAFKHSAAKSTVHIHISVANGILSCECINKIGLVQEERTGDKIGLKNLKKRLQLLYRDSHSLHISENDRYTVRLQLQLNEGQTL